MGSEMCIRDRYTAYLGSIVFLALKKILLIHIEITTTTPGDKGTHEYTEDGTTGAGEHPS